MAALLLLSSPPSWSADADTSRLTSRLFDAVATNNLASVRSSITAGASITAVNKNGQTPAGLAIEKGYFNIAHYILGVRNQRKGEDAEKPDSLMIQLPKGNAPIAVPMRPKVVAPTPPPVRSVNQWPTHKPNPFSPDAKSGAIPTVGELLKPSVQPALPQKAVTSAIKEQPQNIAPLKTASTPPTRTIQAPTPIKPLDKEVAKEDLASPVQENDKGVLDRMVDGVTGVFKSEDTPATKVPSKAEPKMVQNPAPAPSNEAADEQEDDEEDGVIKRVWSNITDLF